MQLAGSRFTDATAVVGNDLATLPNFPAEIRAPAGHARRRLGLPDPLRLPRHPDPRRCAERARRDEPGGAAGQPPGARARRDDHRQRGRVHEAQPREGRLRLQPARGRVAQRLPRPPDPDDDAHPARGRGDRGRLDARRRPRQEPVRARRALVAVRPARGRDRALDRAEVRAQAGRAAGQPRGVQGRLVVRRDDRAARRSVPRARRPPTSRPAPTATSTARPRCRSG